MAVPAIQHNTPTLGSFTWGAFTIRYLNQTFSIGGGSTSNRWVWWEYRGGGANSTLMSGMDIPETLTDDDIVLFGNKNGTGIRVQASTFVDGELIVDGTILSQAISTGAIDTTKISTAGLDAGHIKFGTMSGERIEANTLVISQIDGLGFTDTETGETTIDGSKIATGTVDADAISSDYVYAGEVQATQIRTGQLKADISLVGKITAGEPTAARVQMDSSGIRVFNSANEERTILDSSGTSTFRGDVEAQNLTAGKMTLNGVYNEISAKTELTLAAGITNPMAPPTVANDWYSFQGNYKPWISDSTQTGVHFNSTTTRWVQSVRHTANGDLFVFDTHNSGTYYSTLLHLPPPDTGYTYQNAVQIGSSIYSLRTSGAYYKIEKFAINLPSNVQDIYNGRLANSSSATAARLSTDGTFLYLVEMGADFNSVEVTKLEVAAAVGQNLLPDFSFTSSAAGWTAVYGSISYNSSSDLIYVNINKPATQYARGQSQAVAITAGKQYKAVATVDSEMDAPVHVDLRWFDSAGAFITVTSGAHYYNNASSVTVEGSAPFNATSVRASVQFEPKAGNTYGVVEDCVVYSDGGINFVSKTALPNTGDLTPIQGLYVGSADVGAPRYFISSGNTVRSYNSATGTYQASESFPVPTGVTPSGLMFNGQYFYTLSSENRFYLHESSTKQVDTALRYFSYTWYDSAGTTHETMASPVVGASLARRGRYRITAPVLPGNGGAEDPNCIRVYVGTSADRAAMYLSGTSPLTTNVVTINTFGSSATSPISNNYTGGVPGVIKASTGGFKVGGDSSGGWPLLQPVGAMTMYAGTTAPPGWLLCNGGTFSSVTYPDLAVVVGDKYGVHSGTTYYLPNFTSKFPRGGTPGPGGGSATATLETANLPNHVHGAGTLATGSEGSHSHGVQRRLSVGTGTGNAQGGGSLSPDGNNISTTEPAHTHPITGATADGGYGNTPFDVLNPYISVNFIIKT